MACPSLGPPVQQGQVRLPPNGNDARKYAAVLHGYKGKSESRDERPELTRIDDAGGNGLHDAVDDGGRRAAGECGLRPEEVGVEDGREEELAHGDLGREREEVGGVIEVIR